METLYSDDSAWSGKQVRWIANQNYSAGYTAGLKYDSRRLFIVVLGSTLFGGIAGTALTLILGG